MPNGRVSIIRQHLYEMMYFKYAPMYDGLIKNSMEKMQQPHTHRRRRQHVVEKPNVAKRPKIDNVAAAAATANGSDVSVVTKNEGYSRYDLDILCTCYNVHATVKNLPLLPPDCALDTAISHIETHVVQNRRHFDSTLVDAQRQRNVEKAKDVHWSLRETVQGDIYEWRTKNSP